MIPVLGESLLDWLLGLSKFSLFDEKTRLGWVYDIPAWGWVVIILGSVALAGWSYSKLVGPRWARIGLAGLRAALVILLVALLAGPQLIKIDERIQKDWLLVLVDQSESMTTPDTKMKPTDVVASSVSRDEAIRRIVADHADIFSEENLGKDRRIEWLGFDSATYKIDPLYMVGGEITVPKGRATLLRTAIEQALQRAAGRPIAGIVLLTDGRSPQSTGAELTRRLKQRGVKVFGIPVGAETSPLDLVVARVDHPEKAFINDIVPINVFVERRGSGGAVQDIDPSQIKVTLRDIATGKVLDEQSPEAGTKPSDPVRLTTRWKVAGPVTWRVEVKDTAGDDDELNKTNNQQDFTMALTDRKIRVLYVEGYPRWDYRYLKNMLVRPESSAGQKIFSSSIMLISADREFAQEGDHPITRLPRDMEELEPYDVIIIGDVPSDYLGSQLMGLIRDHVSSRGAALLWVGGAESTPRTYDGTLLADLLPMRRPGVVRKLEIGDAGVVVQPTPIADALSVLKLRSDPTGADQAKWPDTLTPLLWVQDVGQLKPTAEVLAIGKAPGSDDVPVVTQLRYGAGTSMYLSTDEIWRWRFGRGELYPEQFWTQLLQLLGRGRLQQTDKGVTLRLSNRRVETDQTVVITVRVTDSLLLQREMPRIKVAVTKAGDPTGKVLEEIDLVQVQSAADENEIAKRGREYRAEWRPNISGTLEVRVADAAVADVDISQEIRVVRPDDEMRETAADHARLTKLATDTGGEIVPLHEIDRLVTLVKSVKRTSTNDIPESLWDSPLTLMLVVLLLSIEWIGRKVIRLI